MVKVFHRPLPQVFSSSVGQDLILEFTKEMLTMNQFEQVCSRRGGGGRCFFRPHANRRPGPRSSSSLVCCVTRLLCSATATPRLAMAVWRRWSI